MAGRWTQEPALTGHRRAVLAALGMVVAAFLLGTGRNQLSRYPLPLNEPFTGLIRGDVTLKEVRSLWNSSRVVFIDARDSKSFARAHLPGAVHLSAEDFNVELAGMRERLEAPRLIVYCAGPRCPKADLVRDLLEDSGYRRVEVMREGIDGWLKAGYVVEHS